MHYLARHVFSIVHKQTQVKQLHYLYHNKRHMFHKQINTCAGNVLIPNHLYDITTPSEIIHQSTSTLKIVNDIKGVPYKI